MAADDQTTAGTPEHDPNVGNAGDATGTTDGYQDGGNAEGVEGAASAEERAELERTAHDARVAANVAAALAQAWRDELARPPRAPRRPGEGEVPAERFGPTDRRVGSERK